MAKLRVVFFGTPEIAVPSLQALADNRDIQVLAVITKPDKPQGRGKIMAPPEVKIFAESRDLPIFQPENLKTPEFQNMLKQLKADFFVVIAFGKILPPALLQMPKYGCINIHLSLLPKYRGASPVQEALLKGDSHTGVSIMNMEEEMDAGHVYLLKRIPIEISDNFQTLTTKLSVLGGQIIVAALDDIQKKILIPIKQKNELATYCKKIDANAGHINWQKQKAQEIYNTIRAYGDNPGTYTTWNKKRVKILQATYEETQNHTPGSITFLSKNSMGIGTKSGLLIPLSVQLEGKKTTDITTFINGYKKQLTEIPNFE